MAFHTGTSGTGTSGTAEAQIVPARCRPFDTVLVANRGEIAVRVIRTLRRLGIRSVAVYADADAGARHVFEADVAVRIGPAAAARSYLDVETIIAAAQLTGAQAIHPGYGFLSESPALAEACAAKDIVFVGPGVDALAVMGDKIRAKAHVAAHGVPVIPGVSGEAPTSGARAREERIRDADLVAAAADLGYPLLVKPSAGGGGKGMQVVLRAAELPDALATSRRVAASAFGDDTLLLERLIAGPRHIEVQVLADSRGAVVHLGERECSLQRRHQKVVEEAPSVLLDGTTRVRIGQAACAVARSVDYRGAGTVEFLVSAEAPDEFFFMEMNTRLQVEHPVTELVTGLDLVEWQLRIAAGEPLTLTQQDVHVSGHAIEARIYAERPGRDFLPSTGTVLALHEPVGEGIRVDSSLLPGLEVTADYDPLLAKVIAHGTDRDQALDRLDAALAATTVLGVHTNIEYLRSLLADPAVRAGDLDTTLIDRLLPGLRPRRPDAVVLTASALSLHRERWEEAGSLWSRPSGWRIGQDRPCRYVLVDDAGSAVEVLVAGEPHGATVTLYGVGHLVRLRQPSGGDDDAVLVEVDGVSRVLQVVLDGDDVWVGDGGTTFVLHHRSRAEHVELLLAGARRTAGPVRPEVRSPMPGTVVAVHASPGDAVELGQALVSVEAMKMEHKLLAPVAGTLDLGVAVGDLVTVDQVLARIETIDEVPTAAAHDPGSDPQDPAPEPR